MNRHRTRISKNTRQKLGRNTIINLQEVDQINNFEEMRKNATFEKMVKNGSFTPPTPPTQVCFFCGSISSDGEGWIMGELSFGNSAHQTCYEKEETKQREKIKYE